MDDGVSGGRERRQRRSQRLKPATWRRTEAQASSSLAVIARSVFCDKGEALCFDRRGLRTIARSCRCSGRGIATKDQGGKRRLRRPKSMVEEARTKISWPVGKALVRACPAAKTVLLIGLVSAAPVRVLAWDDSFTLDVHVAVAPSCSIRSATPSLDLGELSRPGSAMVSLGFSCNSHFQFVLSSRHGGLKHHTRTAVPPPFVSLVPYAVSYAIGTSRGLLSGACSSASMAQGALICKGASSPDAAAINQTVTLSLSWGLSGQYPVAGAYSDTLSFSVSAGL